MDFKLQLNFFRELNINHHEQVDVNSEGTETIFLVHSARIEF